MHVEMVLRDLGLGKASPVVTLVAKRQNSEELLLLAGAKPLNAEDTTIDRYVTMRINYICLDWPDLCFATETLTRGMKEPTNEAR